MSTIDLQIVSILRYEEIKPIDVHSLVLEIKKLVNTKYIDSLIRNSNEIDFNLHKYADNLNESKLNEMIKLI